MLAEPGRRGARRGARAARRRRRVAARHDARRRREPADLGRHLPREPRGARAPRSPSTAAARAGRGRARGGRRGLPRALDRRGVRRTAAACSTTAYEDSGELQRLRVHVPDRPGVIAGITQALGAERINIADFDLQHLSRERGGTLAILVAGERRGRARGRDPRGAGLRRRRRAGARDEREGRARGVRSPGTSPSPATSRSPTARCCSGASPTARRAIARLRPLRRHRVDARGRARARRRASTRRRGHAARLRRRPARADAAGGADRLRQRGHADAAAARAARRPGGPLRARRRRVALARGRWSAIAEPLRAMGARIETTRRPRAARDRGRRVARRSRYELPVASAQVKSAILLAGLYADGGETTVVEPLPTRDHTERLLARRGRAGRRAARRASRVWPVERLELGELEIPGDFSSAAPFLVAATLLAGLRADDPRRQPQPARTGLLDVLERMGARITVFNRGSIGGEPVGDLDVRPAELVGDDDRRRRGAAARRRAAALRARSPSTRAATASSAAPRSCARRRPTGSRPSSTACARSARTSGATDDGFVVRGVPARLRGRRDRRRAATTGSRCSARSPGSVSREGVEVEGAEAVGGKLPRLLRPPRARLRGCHDTR